LVFLRLDYGIMLLAGLYLAPYQCVINAAVRLVQWSASEYRFKIGDFAPTGPVDPKFQVEGVALPPTILLLRYLGETVFGMV